MKKLIATALICAMMFSLAACSGKQPETTVTETSETTTQVTETTETTAETTTETTTAAETTTETTAATTAKILTKKDYVKNARSKYKSYVKNSSTFYAPELLIKSPYADSVNNKIAALFKSYKKDLKNISGTEYLVYLTKEGILTIVFKEVRKNDTFRVFNIDVTTGEKVDNARMAEIAGVKSVRQAAMDTLQELYNTSDFGLGIIKFKNHKPVVAKGKKLTKDQKKAAATFEKKYLNENMQIGLTDKGKMFFIFTVWTGNYEQLVFEFDEGDLWYEDNPGLVAPK